MSDDFAIPHARPQNKEEWSENQTIADAELEALVDVLSPEERQGAEAIFSFHEKWWYSAGHKHLGRKYKGLAPKSDS